MSLRKAIDEKCKDCIYDSHCHESWRQQVENCTNKTCKLWKVRPVTIKTKKAISVSKMTDKDLEKCRRMAKALNKISLGGG